MSISDIRMSYPCTNIANKQSSISSNVTRRISLSASTCKRSASLALPNVAVDDVDADVAASPPLPPLSGTGCATGGSGGGGNMPVPYKPSLPISNFLPP